MFVEEALSTKYKINNNNKRQQTKTTEGRRDPLPFTFVVVVMTSVCVQSPIGDSFLRWERLVIDFSHSRGERTIIITKEQLKKKGKTMKVPIRERLREMKERERRRTLTEASPDGYPNGFVNDFSHSIISYL